MEETKKDVTIEEAAENYYDFGVDYEPVKEKKVNIEVNNDIKIVNHNEEESLAEKIEVKEESIELPKRKSKKDPVLLEDTKEFEKIIESEENIEQILDYQDSSSDDIPLDTDANDIFNLIDSMYDEEEK